MDGDGLDPAFFENAYHGYGIDRGGVPADADFGRHGNSGGRDRLDYSFGHAGEQGTLSEEGGTAIFAYDFVDWAAEIDVDEVGSFPVDDAKRGLAHAGAVPAKELNTYRALRIIEIRIFSGSIISQHNAFGRDKLGDHDVGAEFFAKAAKDDVCHSRHRSEVQREPAISEPRKHQSMGGPVGGWMA